MLTATPKESIPARVGDYVRIKIIQPLEARGDRIFTVTAGEVHRDLGLQNRVPAVCQALKSKRFLEENHLLLKDVSGPPSGLSTTVKFTYEILSSNPAESRKPNPLWQLRGIAKGLFEKPAGWEDLIKQEREQLSDIHQKIGDKIGR